MKKMKNLKKAIEKLNAPIVLEAFDEFDEEITDSPFSFKVRECDGHIEVYDSNECYSVDYAYETFCQMCDLAREFGFEKPTEITDRIHDNLTEAVKKDFGKDAYLEWYDSVVMWVCE